jgi:hypothetical protein
MHQTLASLLASPSASVLKGMVARKEEFSTSALLFVGPMLRPADCINNCVCPSGTTCTGDVADINNVNVPLAPEFPRIPKNTGSSDFRSSLANTCCARGGSLRFMARGNYFG